MANFSKIKVVAKERGVSLQDLAEQVGITPNGLSILMRTNTTNTQTIEKIAQVLGVKVGLFFDGEEVVMKEDESSVIAQKDAIIAQLNRLLEQKDKIIDLLSRR